MVLPEQARLLQGLHGPFVLDVIGRRVEALRQRHADDVERLHVRAALLREVHGRGDHLLADQTELHGHEDLRQGGLGELRLLAGEATRSRSPSPRCRRTRP